MNKKIKCTAEDLTVKSEVFYFNTYGNFFEGGINQSDKWAFKGRYSAKVISTSPRVFACPFFDYKNGEKFRVTAWRYDEFHHNSSGLEAAIDNEFKINSSYIVSSKDGWERITLDFKAPENTGKPLWIYSYNTDSLPVYMDDFIVERLED